MSSLQLATVPVGYAGLDTESAADSVFKGATPELKNFLVHHESKSVMRGPISNHNELVIGDNEIIAGAWTHGQKVLISLVEKDATAVRDPWKAPLVESAPADLADPQLTMKLVDFVSMGVSDVTTTIDRIAGGKSVSMGGVSYGFAHGSATSDSTSRGYVRRRSLLSWDGTTAAPTVVVDAPDSGIDLKVHYDCLFVLGGRDVPGSSTEHEFNTLYFSDPGGPISADANSWRAASGLTNKIIIDADDINDYGVALAKVGNSLAILKRNSIHVLAGYDVETFQLQTFSTDVGCIDPRSVVEHADGCYFMSQEGYMYFDGAQIQNVSESIRSELVKDIHVTVGGSWVDGARCECTRLPNHYSLITISAQEPSTGDVNYEKSWLYHEPTARWSRFSSDATTTSCPTGLGRAYEIPYITDGTHVLQVPHLTIPEAAEDADRGSDWIGGVGTRIPAQWKSRLLPLTTPQYKAQFHRVLVDYNFTISDTADDEDYGWFVYVQNGNGDEVFAQTQVPTLGDPSSYLYRRRAVLDNFSEADDVQFVVEWKDDGTGTTPAVQKAEIYDCFIEFQITRQRRST